MDIILETAKNWIIVGIMVTIIGLGINWITGWFEGVLDSQIMLITYTDEELQKVYDDCVCESKKHKFRNWLKTGFTKGYIITCILVWPNTIFLAGWYEYLSMKKIVTNLKELHRLRR